MRRVVVLVVAGLWLAACGRSGGPAPVVYGDGGDSPRAAQTRPQQQAPPLAQVGQAGLHTVRPGDTLSEIAAAYRVPMRRLAEANDLDPPYVLRVGQRLRIPVQRPYTVRKGDTVYRISRRFQVPIRAIIDANDLAPPYLLRVGQILEIPVPRKHVVNRGDTLYGISRRYDVDLSELARLNGLSPPYTITPGQQLLIPASGGRGTTQVARTSGETSAVDKGEAASASPPTESRSSVSTESDTTGEPSTGGASMGGASTGGEARRRAREAASESAERQVVDVPKPPVRPASLGRPPPREIPTPPARAGGRFAWPVRGEIVAGFGPQDDGLHNDGINIAAPRGTAIRAAENGVVAYVGNELRGFGNLLLIKHADDWITAYAHCERIRVQHGARVQRGQTVAVVGSSGGVARPQLHFEIRRGSKAVDPIRMLGRLEAALRRSGG